jgi:hypothetical protein
VNPPADLHSRRARTALRRSFVFGAALVLALLAPGVALAIGTTGGSLALVAEEFFPTAIQTARGDVAKATRSSRAASKRSARRLSSHRSAAVPRSLVRSSVSARHGPPPLRGPPALALR